jgi:hypothetical protein
VIQGAVEALSERDRYDDTGEVNEELMNGVCYHQLSRAEQEVKDGSPKFVEYCTLLAERAAARNEVWSAPSPSR